MPWELEEDESAPKQALVINRPILKPISSARWAHKFILTTWSDKSPGLGHSEAQCWQMVIFKRFWTDCVHFCGMVYVCVDVCNTYCSDKWLPLTLVAEKKRSNEHKCTCTPMAFNSVFFSVPPFYIWWAHLIYVHCLRATLLVIYVVFTSRYNKIAVLCFLTGDL